MAGSVYLHGGSLARKLVYSCIWKWESCMEEWDGMDGRKGRMEVRIRALGLRSILTCNGMAWHGTYRNVLGRKTGVGAQRLE
jgi:hypothetical protein